MCYRDKLERVITALECIKFRPWCAYIWSKFIFLIVVHIYARMYFTPLYHSNRTRAWHVSLPDGPGQVNLPVKQDDFDKVVFNLIFNLYWKTQNFKSQASENFQIYWALRIPLHYLQPVNNKGGTCIKRCAPMRDSISHPQGWAMGCLDFNAFWGHNGACHLVAIAGTTVPVPCHIGKSLQLIWVSGTCRSMAQCKTAVTPVR